MVGRMTVTPYEDGENGTISEFSRHVWKIDNAENLGID